MRSECAVRARSVSDASWLARGERRRRDNVSGVRALWLCRCALQEEAQRKQSSDAEAARKLAEVREVGV